MRILWSDCRFQDGTRLGIGNCFPKELLTLRRYHILCYSTDSCNISHVKQHLSLLQHDSSRRAVTALPLVEENPTRGGAVHGRHWLGRASICEYPGPICSGYSEAAYRYEERNQ